MIYCAISILWNKRHLWDRAGRVERLWLAWLIGLAKASKQGTAQGEPFASGRHSLSEKVTIYRKEGAAAQQSRGFCRAIPMDKLTIPCEEWAPKLAALHAGDLSSAERAELEDHLASCPACAAVRADYERLAEQVRQLPERASQQDVPPKVRELWNKHNYDQDKSHPLSGSVE